MNLDTAERVPYLARVGRDDPDLRGEVESLLAAAESAGDGVLSEPPLAAIGLPPLQTTWIGRRLGPYRLTEEIGAGGMGEVYKAVRADEEYRHEVAIKLVHSGRGSSFVGTRFRAERQILATLQHPNICRLLDGGTTCRSARTSPSLGSGC
jgi:serine/threonine protein kinase